jgi:hypothetical protein
MNSSTKNERMDEKTEKSLPTKRQHKRPKLSLQNVSICILAVACFTLCAMPGIIFNGLNILMGKSWFGEETFQLTALWARTLLTINSSFNSLVFFWKNSILRTEGKKVLRKLL